MIKKFFFCLLFLGLLFTLVVNISPAQAADCICYCREKNNDFNSEFTTTSLEKCTQLCTKINGTVQTGGCNSGTAPTTPIVETEDPPPSAPTVKLDNPLSVDSPTILIGRIIDSILGIVGSLALLMFVFGGLTWMTSSGNQEKVKKGRDIIVWSAIGLAIIFMSYALTRFVLSTITK
jgi:hypothetical protein